MRWSVRSLALTQVVLVLAACSGAPATSSTPSSSAASLTPAPIDSPLPSPSPEPTASESAAPTEPVVDAVPIPPDTYARVVANDLRVRSKPGVSDDSKKLEPLLQDGKLVVVLEGPVRASGYDWYRIQPVITEDFGTPDPSGWVAAGLDGEPWIQPETVECKPLPTTVEELGEKGIGLAMLFEITCFGGRDITFRARVGWFEADCEYLSWWAVDPAWLDPCGNTNALLVPVSEDDIDVRLVPDWAPDVDTSIAGDPLRRETWPIVDITGQYDHPAARTCRTELVGTGTDDPQPDPAQTVLSCRLRFVVTSMREVDG